MAALELTSRLIYAIQSTAETAYDMVSPGPSVRRKSRGQKGRRKRYNQPQDIREGMANAYMLVKEVRKLPFKIRLLSLTFKVRIFKMLPYRLEIISDSINFISI